MASKFLPSEGFMRERYSAKAPFAYGRKEEPYGEVNSVGPGTAARLAEAFGRLLARP